MAQSANKGVVNGGRLPPFLRINELGKAKFGLSGSHNTMGLGLHLWWGASLVKIYSLNDFSMWQTEKADKGIYQHCK